MKELTRPRRIRLNRKSLLPRLLTSCCIENSAQSSIEAAILLPSLFIVLALMLQPGLILYSRICMYSAASEACRLYAVQAEAGPGRYAEDRYREFIEHRLSAIPYIDIFHLGGEDGWDISYAQESDYVEVKIAHALKPLPLLGVTGAALGDLQADGSVRVEVSSRSQIRPHWLKGGYSDWQSQWS